MSILLVTLQFGLIAIVAWLAAPTVSAGHTAQGAWAISASSVLLAAWSLSSNRPGNFNVHLIPRAGGELVQSGPYRWIRHPMYT